MRVTSTAVLFAMMAAPAMAQTPVSAPDNEPREIIVTAPLEGAAFESLQGAAALSRDDIVATLNRGLGDTLDALPGVSTTFFGAGASRPIIRGLGEDRVRVLQNGVGAIDASTASPDHAVTSDGLDAERIEVLRGAAALAYGGNAVGGVVNVIDQSIPTRAPANGFAAQALAGATSVDDGWQGEARLVGALAGPLVAGVSVAARNADDYAIPDQPTDRALNSWAESRAFAGGAAFVDGWGHVGFAVKRSENEYGLPPEDAAEPGGRIDLEQTRYEARGDVAMRLGPFDRADFALQVGDYQHTEFEGSGEPGTRFTNEGWEARVEAHHAGLGDALDGAVGVQASDIDFAAVGEEAFLTPTQTQVLGAFVIERWDSGAWGLEGGARVERTEHDNTVFGGRDFDATSASVGVFARPAPGWFAAATLARTERAPSAVELFSDGPHLATANYEIGDPGLDVEVATSFEISLRYAAPRLRVEANLYRAAFDDYVALVDTGTVFWADEDAGLEGFAPSADDPSVPAGAETLPVFQFSPRDATFVGGEVSASAQIATLGAFAIGVDGAVDYVRASFDGDGPAPRIPPRTLTLGVTADSARLSARLEAVDTAKQDRVAAFESETEGFAFVNARLAFRPQGEDGPLTLLLDARNLGDELGRVHASFLKDEFPLPGRSIRAAIVARY
ncbi:MAG: TonB-dependent receptor [Hyphomonadaceae bacterium]|nr:TonB-dependent receptor [Hyphomonadaceae bacterium]